MSLDLILIKTSCAPPPIKGLPQETALIKGDEMRQDEKSTLLDGGGRWAGGPPQSVARPPPQPSPPQIV